MNLWNTSIGQGQITKSIVTRLNIGLLIIITSIYLADMFVSNDINECMDPPLFMPGFMPGQSCLDENPLWVVLALVSILSASVIVGAILVIQYMLSFKRLRLLLFAEFASFTLYPSYTVYRVLAELRFCQQVAGDYGCFAQTNDIYKGTYIISLHTIILGIAFLITLFYIHRKRQVAIP